MKRTRGQHGFAVVELLLVAIIILAVAGIGYWVYQQRSKSASLSETPIGVLSKEAAARKAATYAQQAIEDEATQVSKTNDDSQALADSDASAQIGDSGNATD